MWIDFRNTHCISKSKSGISGRHFFEEEKLNNILLRHTYVSGKLSICMLQKLKAVHTQFGMVAPLGRNRKTGRDTEVSEVTGLGGVTYSREPK